MTGRDLIVYILENNLEDEEVFKDGKFVGLLTEEEAALMLNCGVASIKALVELGTLEGVSTQRNNYIYANVIQGGSSEKEK